MNDIKDQYRSLEYISVQQAMNDSSKDIAFSDHSGRNNSSANEGVSSLHHQQDIRKIDDDIQRSTQSTFDTNNEEDKVSHDKGKVMDEKDGEGFDRDNDSQRKEGRLPEHVDKTKQQNLHSIVQGTKAKGDEVSYNNSNQQQRGNKTALESYANSNQNEQQKIAIFLNTYIHPNNTQHGFAIVTKLLHNINKQSKLDDAEIYYSRFGHLDIPWPKGRCRGRVGHSCQEIKSSVEGDEVETLQALYDYCKLPDNEHNRVIYMHSKGSHTPSGNNEVLRKILAFGVLSDECIDMPKDKCSVCSTQFATRPFFHYGGNMWVSDCTYIRKLIPPQDFTEAKEKLMRTVLNGTTPSEHIGVHVTHTTNLTSADGTQVLYHFPSSQFYATVREPWFGVGRFAMEHYILSHPDARPCDVFSKRDSRVPEIIYGVSVDMEKLNWRIKRGLVKPSLNIVSDYIRQGGVNHTYTIYGADCLEPNHPWYWKDGRVYQYKALYPETGGPAEDSWLYDFWGHLKPMSKERECIFSKDWKTD